MPISNEFLNLFGNFIANYKHNGASAFFNWTKEHNHSAISRWFDELFTIITTNKESLHNASIIESLSIRVILAAKSNPYLLTCWINFINEYNISSKQYAPIGNIELNVGLSGVPSEKMIHELKTALLSQQMTLASTQNVHQAELEQLRKEISELQKANGLLRQKNDQLNALAHNREEIEALHPQIQTAQEQLASFSTLLNTLLDATKTKPVTAPLTIAPSTPQAVTKPIVENEERKEEHEKSSVAISCIVGDSIETKKEQSLIPSPPPLPLPLPPQNPAPKVINTVYGPPPEQKAKAEPTPLSSNQSFFAPTKNGQLLDGINGVLAKMKARKEARTTLDQNNVHEKKRSSDESIMTQPS